MGAGQGDSDASIGLGTSGCLKAMLVSRTPFHPYAAVLEGRGRALRKEDTPMRFLRVVAVAVLASLIAAMVLRLLNG